MAARISHWDLAHQATTMVVDGLVREGLPDDTRSLAETNLALASRIREGADELCMACPAIVGDTAEAARLIGAEILRRLLLVDLVRKGIGDRA